MRYEHSTDSARLELRIAELEDISASLICIVRLLSRLIEDAQERAADHTIALAGLLSSLPSTAPRGLLPSISVPIHPEPGSGGCCGRCASCGDSSPAGG